MKPERRIDTHLGRVGYVAHGDGEPVLVIHGSPGGSDQGALMGAFLVERGFRVIAPSRPGYLSTPLTERTSTPDGQADLQCALMDALEIERFALVCWSGGGPSGYRLASKYPQRVTSMAMLAAASKRYVFAEANDMMYRLIVSRAGAALMRALVRFMPKTVIAMSTSEGNTLDKAQAKALAEQIWSDPQMREFVLAIAQTVGGRAAGLNNDVRQFPLIDDLQLNRITSRTLLVHGTADTDVPIGYSEFASSEIAGSELVRVPDGTHVCTWASPQSHDLQERIAAYLTRT